MNNYNYHPIRWYAATLATLASGCLWFTWTKSVQQNFYFVAEKADNGYHGWGFLTLAGIVGVFAATFMGDRMKPFDQSSRLIACVSFVVIALGGIITLASSSSNGFTGEVTKAGPGPWIAIVLGVVGLILSVGVLKIPVTIQSSSSVPPASPPPPPPPSSSN